MRNTNTAGPQIAGRLLLHEGCGQNQFEFVHRAAAEGRVHCKVIRHIGPIVGQACLERSSRRSLCLATVTHQCLGAEPPAVDPWVDTEAAATLFETFFRLLAALVGEALVSRLQEDAWPEIDWHLPARTP